MTTPARPLPTTSGESIAFSAGFLSVFYVASLGRGAWRPKVDLRLRELVPVVETASGQRRHRSHRAPTQRGTSVLIKPPRERGVVRVVAEVAFRVGVRVRSSDARLVQVREVVADSVLHVCSA